MPFPYFHPPEDAEAALNRYASFIRRATSMSVTIRATSSMLPGQGSATFTIAKPYKIAFSAQWGTLAISYFQDARHLAEVNRISRTYREWPAIATPLGPPNEVSNLGRFTFPYFLLENDLHKLGGGLKAKLQKRIPGSKSQTIHLSFETSEGTNEVQLTIDEQGKPLQVSHTIANDQGRMANKHIYTNWVVGKHYPDSLFAGVLEPGYKAESLAVEDIPIQAGEPFPLKNWVVKGRSGDLQQTLLGNRFILVAVRPACENSRKLLRFLQANRQVLERAGAAIAALSLDGSDVASPFPLYVHSGQSGILDLRVSGTPTMFVVEKSGICRQLWFPVLQDDPKALLAEILAAIKRK